MEFLASPEVWASLATLTALEIVLGIDNIIFISILSGALPVAQQARARRWGLLGALLSRLLLLSLIFLIVKLDQPWFAIVGIGFTGKSLVLLMGGLFLIYKATKEIHSKLEGPQEEGAIQNATVHASFSGVVLQITLLDVVFSLDSVITAVGLTPHISIMVVANIIALAIMLAASEAISGFVERHRSIKVLAMAFLLMIGLVLVAEGLSFHIPKGYVYFAMGFSLLVEFINIRSSSNPKH